MSEGTFFSRCGLYIYQWTGNSHPVVIIIIFIIVISCSLFFFLLLLLSLLLRYIEIIPVRPSVMSHHYS